MTGNIPMGSTQPISIEIRFPDWFFWIKWTVASMLAVVSIFAIIPIIMYLGIQVTGNINEDRFFGIAFFPVLGLMLGLLQGLVLRNRFQRSGWWILATPVGMLVGVAVSAGIVQFIHRFGTREWDWRYLPGLLLIYGLIGFCMAGAQYLVFRRSSSLLALWLLTNVLGWLALGLLIGKSMDSSLEVIAVGLVPAIFSGIALSWCLKSPVQIALVRE
jgi:hypothetical protein